MVVVLLEARLADASVDDAEGVEAEDTAGGALVLDEPTPGGDAGVAFACSDWRANAAAVAAMSWATGAVRAYPAAYTAQMAALPTAKSRLDLDVFRLRGPRADIISPLDAPMICVSVRDGGTHIPKDL